MSTHYQIDNYADFKAMVGALTAGPTFYKGTPGTGNALSLLYVSTDGHFIVSNVVNSGASQNAITDPGTFATDFPAAVHLTTGNFPVLTPD